MSHGPVIKSKNNIDKLSKSVRKSQIEGNKLVPRDEIGETTSGRDVETQRVFDLGERVFMWKETVVDGMDGDGVIVGGVRFTVGVGGNEE